jgi:hypothetical protein
MEVIMEMDYQFYFAGVGFSSLSLSIGGNSSAGALSFADPAAESVPLGDISFDAAAGDVSFQAAQSGWNVRNITFTGSIIADAAGNVAGLEGTWKGTWIPVVVGRAAETAKARALPGIGLFPSATGTWAAVAHEVME